MNNDVKFVYVPIISLLCEVVLLGKSDPNLYPYYVAVFDTEIFKLFLIKIFIALRMWIATYEISNIDNLNSIIVEV